MQHGDRIGTYKYVHVWSTRRETFKWTIAATSKLLFLFTNTDHNNDCCTSFFFLKYALSWQIKHEMITRLPYIPVHVLILVLWPVLSSPYSVYVVTCSFTTHWAWSLWQLFSVVEKKNARKVTKHLHNKFRTIHTCRWYAYNYNTLVIQLRCLF